MKKIPHQQKAQGEQNLRITCPFQNEFSLGHFFAVWSASDRYYFLISEIYGVYHAARKYAEINLVKRGGVIKHIRILDRFFSNFVSRIELNVALLVPKDFHHLVLFIGSK